MDGPRGIQNRSALGSIGQASDSSGSGRLLSLLDSCPATKVQNDTDHEACNDRQHLDKCKVVLRKERADPDRGHGTHYGADQNTGRNEKVKETHDTSALRRFWRRSVTSALGRAESIEPRTQRDPKKRKPLLPDSQLKRETRNRTLKAVARIGCASRASPGRQWTAPAPRHQRQLEGLEKSRVAATKQDRRAAQIGACGPLGIRQNYAGFLRGLPRGFAVFLGAFRAFASGGRLTVGFGLGFRTRMDATRPPSRRDREEYYALGDAKSRAQ